MSPNFLFVLFTSFLSILLFSIWFFRRYYFTFKFDFEGPLCSELICYNYLTLIYRIQVLLALKGSFFFQIPPNSDFFLDCTSWNLEFVCLLTGFTFLSQESKVSLEFEKLWAKLVWKGFDGSFWVSFLFENFHLIDR